MYGFGGYGSCQSPMTACQPTMTTCQPMVGGYGGSCIGAGIIAIAILILIALGVIFTF